jgi:DNA-binding Lrp family transcriptional regulator
LDALDEQIIALLVEDARRTFADIGSRVGLSTAAVKRRVDRLRAQGVISRFSAVLDPGASGPAIDAFVELYCADRTAPGDVHTIVEGHPELVGAWTVAGEPDAIVRLRVRDVKHLEKAVERLRRDRNIVRTRTLIVLSTLHDAPLGGRIPPS